MSNLNYAFAVANIRSLEKKLVTQNQLERIIDAPDASAFFEALADSAYGKHFSLTNQPECFQTIIDAELSNCKKVLIRITPYFNQLDWLWLKYDFLNLKLAIKHQLAGKESMIKEFNNLGNLKPQNIISYLKTQEKSILPGHIAQAIAETLKLYEQTKSPSIIDEYLDKLYFKLLKDELRKIHSSKIKDVIKTKIDLYNFKLLVRYKYLQKDTADLPKRFVSGGHIDRDDITNSLLQNLDELHKNTKFFIYRDILQAGIEYLIQNKSYIIFEKMFYEYLVSQLKFARYEAFGIEPLVAYWMAKDNEAKILQIAMIGKLNDLENKLIHRQMHKLYTQK